MKRIAFALASLSLAAAAHAQVTVSDPWVRATVPQQKATGLFMHIDAAQDVKLVAGQSPVAGVVEIHEMVMENDVMKMREIPGGLEIAKGRTMSLKPGGYHVMLMDLKAPLTKDSTVPVTLFFQNAQGVESQQELVLPVALKAPGAMGAPVMPMQHNKH